MLVVLALLPALVFAQLGVAFHQSNLPFVGINYQFKHKFRAEVRAGLDNYIDATSLEGVLTYDVVQKDDYQVYTGLGGRTSDFSGLVIPIGLIFIQ